MFTFYHDPPVMGGYRLTSVIAWRWDCGLSAFPGARIARAIPTTWRRIAMQLSS